MRRPVRATPGFFEDFDRQLPAVRGSDGRPSGHDVLVHDLLRVIEAFASHFEELPPLTPVDDVHRVLVSTGVVVPRFAIVSRAAPDGAIELFQLDIEHHPEA